MIDPRPLADPSPCHRRPPVELCPYIAIALDQFPRTITGWTAGYSFYAPVGYGDYASYLLGLKLSGRKNATAGRGTAERVLPMAGAGRAA